MDTLKLTLLLLACLCFVWINLENRTCDCEIHESKESKNTLPRSSDTVHHCNSGPDPEPQLDPNIPIQSQLVTFSQIFTPWYNSSALEMGEEPRLHRKQWEYVYIYTALKQLGKLKPGMKGIGFGVGREPLAGLFCKHGASVLATDQPPSDDSDLWAKTNEHMTAEVINERKLCPPEQAEKLLKHQFMKMDVIPPEVQNYDFVYSCGSLEHIGTIKQSIQYIMDSIKILRPGGVAVHTTEYNVLSYDYTVDSAGTVSLRQKDFRELEKQITAAGHKLVKLNFNLGTQPQDYHIDYQFTKNTQNHMKVHIYNDLITTSIGLVIHRGDI
jgi:hypothetical protein